MVDPLSYFSFQPVLHDWYNTALNETFARSRQCSTTGVTKAMVCVILSVG